MDTAPFESGSPVRGATAGRRRVRNTLWFDSSGHDPDDPFANSNARTNKKRYVGFILTCRKKEIYWELKSIIIQVTMWIPGFPIGGGELLGMCIKFECVDFKVFFLRGSVR